MNYPEFGIAIENCRGVSRTAKATLSIAWYAAHLRPESAAGGVALDLGTGAGFVAIYLQSQGWECRAADISPAALQCAVRNAAANGMQLAVQLSDLFGSISGQFDLIVFNPPYGHSTSGLLTRPVEFLKSLMSRDSALIANLGYVLIKRQRRRLISRFLEQLPRHLREDGTALLVLHPSELDLVASWQAEVLEQQRWDWIVALQRPAHPAS